MASDDLRTRIAAVLTGYVDHGHRYDLADMLIRELDMFKEDGECSYCHAQLPGCRYICDWRTDD